MKLEKLLVALFILVVSGCTSKTDVHLYGRYLSEEQTQNISQQLTESGFDVVVNKLQFPTSITRPTILYSPMVKNAQQIYLVVDVLAQENVPAPAISPLVSGNHWYKKDSIALFLFPEGESSLDAILVQDLMQTFNTRNCDLDLTLAFNKNGSYVLSGKNWDVEQKTFSTGEWLYRQYPYIELRPDLSKEQIRYFEIKQYNEADKVSDIQIIELMPVQSHQLSGDCSFVFGTRIKPDDL